MNVTYIIPIKKYLATYFLTKDGPITERKVRAITYTFDLYAGYIIMEKELINRYLNWELYTRAKPNQYPKDLISVFSPDKYTYLKVNLPVRPKREIWGRFKHGFILTIRSINSALLYWFWRDCMYNIESVKGKTIDQVIAEYYKEHGLNETELKMSSFKTILYRKRINDIQYNHLKNHYKMLSDKGFFSMSRKERKELLIELSSKKI